MFNDISDEKCIDRNCSFKLTFFLKLFLVILKDESRKINIHIIYKVMTLLINCSVSEAYNTLIVSPAEG